jgi:DNA-binding LacI/PurR family transcriptional regulator
MPTAFVDQIYGDIEGKIRTGELPANEKIPSLEEIGRCYGASVGAVRHAIRKLARDGLVYPVPGKGTFVGSGRGLENSKKLSQILMLVTEDKNGLDSRTRDIMRGIEREADYRGCQVVYNEVPPDAESLQRRFKTLNSRTFDGIVHIGSVTGQTAPILKTAGIPVVLTGDLMDSPHLDDTLDTVTNNRYAEAIMIIDELVRLGHWRIGYFTPFDHTAWGLITRDGMNSGLRGHGLTLEKEYDFSFPQLRGPEMYRLGMDMAHTLAQKIDQIPTAFFSAEDIFARGFTDALLDRGIKVPEQISVCVAQTIIWGDIPVRGQYTLSGISVSCEIIGNVAVQRVLALKKPGAVVGRHTITGSWVNGTTAGPAARR